MKNLKGTWPQALRAFLFPILLVLTIRWAVVEPFVIPSGSMIPTLLIHDHIIVAKLSYGLKVPFFDRWLLRWKDPTPGDVMVFKFPEKPEVYYIKRLIGVPGDEIRVSNGRISVDGREWAIEPLTELEQRGIKVSSDDETDKFSYFEERNGQNSDYRIRFFSEQKEQSDETVYKLGPKQYFFMGDNRDQSSDGRVWGVVDEKLLVGKAWMIWLSCEETLSSAPFVCDPTRIRWDRFFKRVQ